MATLKDENQQLTHKLNDKNKEIQKLHTKIAAQCKEIALLRGSIENLEKSQFRWRNIAADDHLVNFFTGLPSKEVVCELYNFLNPDDKRSDVIYRETELRRCRVGEDARNKEIWRQEGKTDTKR
jgi:hypothetical protein